MPIAKTIAVPEWVDSGSHLTDGLDLLGLRLPVQTIGGSLLDGVTTVTPSVRYIAIRAWLIYRYGESYLPDSWRQFTDFSSYAECALVLGNLIENRSMNGLIGADEGIIRLDSQVSHIGISSLVKTPAATVYAGPSEQLHVSWSRGEKVPGIRIVSLLFRGNTSSAPGLLRAVERRYVDDGRGSIFREIVGDGTLWMVLVATLGNSTWQGIGTTLDKALAIREVFRSPELISSAQVSRLAGLLNQLRIDGARSYLAIVAPETSKLLDCIELEIRPVWEQEARAQMERSITHHVGDWLWRANVGWAICLADASGRDALRVRLRGAETKVGAGFYVNVSELATRDHRLSERLIELRKLLVD